MKNMLGKIKGLSEKENLILDALCGDILKVFQEEGIDKSYCHQ